MSISDLMLLCALPGAVMSISRTTRPLAALLRLIAIYEVVLLVVVSTHASSYAIIEWAHRLGLMGGGVLVGAAVARLGSVRIAIRGLFATAAVFASAAAFWSVTHSLAIAYPLGIHKNAAGGLLAMTIALLATMPHNDIIPARAYRPLYVLYGAGLLATRSRGAMVGVAVALLVFEVTRRGTHRLRVIVAVTAIAGVVYVWTSVQDERRTDVNRTGSLSQRDRQQDEASASFRAHRFTGAGIRYYDENFALATAGRPSSTLYEVAAESGVVGIADLFLLVSGVFIIFRRVDSPYAATAMAVFGVKAVHALFDNFWVAGPFTLPWLVMGFAAMTLGPSSDDSNSQPADSELALARR